MVCPQNPEQKSGIYYFINSFVCFSLSMYLFLSRFFIFTETLNSTLIQIMLFIMLRSWKNRKSRCVDGSKLAGGGMLNAAYMEYKNCVTMPISEKAEYVLSWDWWCRRVFTAA